MFMFGLVLFACVCCANSDAASRSRRSPSVQDQSEVPAWVKEIYELAQDVESDLGKVNLNESDSATAETLNEVINKAETCVTRCNDAGQVRDVPKMKRQMSTLKKHLALLRDLFRADDQTIAQLGDEDLKKLNGAKALHNGKVGELVDHIFARRARLNTPQRIRRVQHGYEAVYQLLP
jgi:hypothetical protein